MNVCNKTRDWSVILLTLCALSHATDASLLSTPEGSVNPQCIHITAAPYHQTIEDDWIKSTQPSITSEADAAGGCDGIKNGTYGFHVGYEAHPWWQIDLGTQFCVERIRVFNRLDYAPGLHNADTLRLFASNDGTQWIQIYDNEGQHFGGITGLPPLEIHFEDNLWQARYLRITIPSDTPIFLHLDEVEIYACGDPNTNIALNKSADQSSLSPWSTAKITRPNNFSVLEWVERGLRLAEYLQNQGVDLSDEINALTSIQHHLLESSTPLQMGSPVLKDLYLKTRWMIRSIVFKNPLLNFAQLLFVKRFTQETYPDVCLNHMPWVSKPGGDLCILTSPSETTSLFRTLSNPLHHLPDSTIAHVTHLLNGALGPGHVHGMDLWFDGDRIVFGYARKKSNVPPTGWLDRTQSYRLRREVEPTHLYELNLTTGILRQITDGEWSDLDPTYAPNGTIIFVSERCGTSLQCNEYDKDETSCNLYVVRPDGTGIRRLSVNKDGDYLPRCLENGLIGYTRWEYHERSYAFIQSLWTIRPDGTGADALFKQHLENPWALEDVRSIPNSHKLVAIATGHHTLATGPVVIINHHKGINEPSAIAIVTPTIVPPEGGMSGFPVPEGGVKDHNGFYSTPWPLSEKFFLVSYSYGEEMTNPTGYGIYLIDVFGNRELIYRDPEISCFLPMPLGPRPFPPILPEMIDPTLNYAECVVTNITDGCEGISPEQARYLRIAEPIAWPYDNHDGGHRYGEDHRYSGPDAERRNLTNWTPVRILGDVPVSADGNVRFRVPPDTAVYFQLLDANRMEIRRMRSFISFQPGEVRGCVGCHETQNITPTLAHSNPSSDFITLSEMLKPPWGDKPINFLRDVQPVLDKHCTTCHSGLNPAGGLDLYGGLIGWDDEVLHYGHNRSYETILEHTLIAMSPVRVQDASVTPPFAYGSHKSKLILALNDETHTHAVSLSEEDHLRLVMWIDANGPYHDRFVNKRSTQAVYSLPLDKHLYQTLLAIHEKRCTSCHDPKLVTRLDWIDLYTPTQSLFLTAPLVTKHGGTQRCSDVVYATTNDADYTLAAIAVQEAVDRTWKYPRRDLAALNRFGDISSVHLRQSKTEE